jgi:hypothetical protein
VSGTHECHAIEQRMRQGAEISVGSLKRLFVLSHISAYAPVCLFKEKPILARPVARQNNCISARIGGRARQSAGNARKRESGEYAGLAIMAGLLFSIPASSSLQECVKG